MRKMLFLASVFCMTSSKKNNISFSPSLSPSQLEKLRSAGNKVLTIGGHGLETIVWLCIGAPLPLESYKQQTERASCAEAAE